MTNLLHFKQTYPVRFDECNRYGQLTLAAVLRYLQDIAGLHVEHAGLQDSGLWIARRTVMHLRQAIGPRSRLEIETFSLGFSRVSAQRAYLGRLVGPDGRIEDRPAIEARTLWVYLDSAAKLARIPEYYARYWQPDGPLNGRPVQFPKEAAWPDPPPGPPQLYQASVRFSDLDLMGHMNNAAYAELLDNAAYSLQENIAATLRPYFLDIEYLESALLDDPLVVHSWQYPAEPGEVPAGVLRLQHIRRGEKLLARALSGWTTA